MDFESIALDIDATDLRILSELQRDASRSNQDLAQAVHVSPATCLRRVRRLVDAGYVERTVALLSPNRLGHGLSAIVEVTLDQQSAQRLDAFEARVAPDPAVQQCWRTSGGPDFVLVMHTADMQAHLAAVQRLLTDDANVRNVKTFFAVKRAKFEPALNLPARPIAEGG